MTKLEAIAMIDAQRNLSAKPSERLRWTWLRAILFTLDDETWADAVNKAVDVMP